MAAAKSNTNWFAIGVSAAVVVVLVVLGGLVVFLNNQATAPGVAPDGGNVNQETGAISFGGGDDEVDVFVDFMCPICGDFEDAYGEQLQSAAASDDITLNIHPISILDRYSQNTKYSTRAAGAAYCVAENAPDSFLDFFNFMFSNQPEENTAGYTDEELASYAEQVGAGAAADGAAAVVRSLLAQPAACTIPLATATVVVVSLLDRHGPPLRTDRFLRRLHVPELRRR